MAPRTAVHTRAADERPDALWDMERSLRRRGFTVVAGADEAGRGACAGPLVAAACVLPPGKRGRVPGLADSKLLTAAARERVYAEVVDRAHAVSLVLSNRQPGCTCGHGASAELRTDEFTGSEMGTAEI